MPEFPHRYGPVALVTGAAQGIGQCFVDALVQRGLEVVAVDADADGLARTCDRAREAGGCATPLVVDLSNDDHAQQIDDATGDRDIGLVIHNAAWAPLGPFAETSAGDLAKSIDINVRSPALLARAFAPRLLERGRGGMIFMSSLASLVGAPRLAAYAASRAYTRSLGETLWTELGPQGVDVLVAMPGATRTEGFWASGPKSDGLAAVPLADPRDVAREALDALGDGPIRVLGPKNRLTEVLLNRILPRRLANRVVGANLERLYGP